MWIRTVNGPERRMQKTESRVNELVRWNAKKGGRYVQALALDLSREAEARVGKVYGIMAVDAPNNVGEALFAQVEDAFGRGVLEALRRHGVEAGHEQTFEFAITQVNHAVSRMFGERGFGIEPEFVSAALLSLKDNDVVAAVWGSPSVLLYHSSPDRPAKVLDLVDDSAAEPLPFRAAPAKRCFGSVISGRIGSRDWLVLATQDLRELLGNGELEACTASDDHAAATALIRERLAPTRDELSIAALVLDVAPVRYLEEPSVAKPTGPQSSLADLRMLQSRTSDVLSPFPLSIIQKKIAGAAIAAGEKLRSLRRARSEDVMFPAGTRTPAARAGDEGVRGQELTVAEAPKEREHAVISTAYAAKDALYAAGRRVASAAKAALTPARRHQAATAAVERFNALAPRRRLLLFFAMFLVASFNASVFVGSLQRARTDVISAREGRYAAAEQKIDSAEASMIYKDDDRARKLLGEATAAIAALPGKRSKNKDKKDALQKRVADAYEQLRHAVALPPPEIVATVATNGGRPSLSRIAFLKKDGVIWSASDKGEIFRVSAADGTARKAATVAGGAAPRVFVAVPAGLIAASGSGEAAFVPDKGETAYKKIAMDPSSRNGAVSDADIYNSRLYVLDAEHNRILRHSPDAAGFGKPQFYLKDGTDVSRAVSISIDGAVYVLNSNGSVLRLVKGVQETFAAARADPPMTDAKRIRVAADSDDLYILGGSPARLLRYNKKSGSLMAQFTSPSLEGATDFAVDAKNKTALVSVRNQLLKFTLPQ